MGVVTAARLRRFMSNPKWSAEQEQTAADLCVEMEAGLEAALGGTMISPQPYAEAAPLIAKTGLVDTSYPVFAVTSLNGAAVAEGAALPTGWRITRHRLFQRVQASGMPPSLITVPAVHISDLTSWGGAWGHADPGQPYGATIELEYLAGWGPEPVLCNAILRKCAAFMQGRHSDVVVAQGLDGAAPPPPATEEWTPNELTTLGRFRRLGIGGT